MRTSKDRLPAPSPGSTEAQPATLTVVARWMMGLRLVAVSALLLGAVLVQTATEEILPIAPLMQVTGLTYGLSLLWLALWLVHIPRQLHGALQLGGDLVTFGFLIYVTGGPASPFAFLFLITVAVGAVMFGLRGALTVAGGAFVLYGGMVELISFHLIPQPNLNPVIPPPGQSTISFQILVTGAGFAIVAMLTSYLAQSVKRAESRLRGEQAASARLFALSADILHSVDSGVVATDLEGKIILANPVAEQTLRERGPIEGSTLPEVLPLEGVDWAHLLGQAAEGAPVRLEGTLLGGGVPLGCTITPLTAEGNPVGAVVHFRDLTEARDVARRERLHEDGGGRRDGSRHRA